MSWVGTNLCVGWAHYQLRGTWARPLAWTCVYTLALGVLILISERLALGPSSTTMSTWASILISLQLGLPAMLGSSSIRAAIQGDFANGMMESHRLMPVSGGSVILGYITGPVIRALAIFAANAILGTFVAMAASLPPRNWLLANLVILEFLIATWCLITLLGMLRIGTVGLTIIVGVVALTGGVALGILPALTVLCPIMIGQTVFGIPDWGLPWNVGTLLAFVLQPAAVAVCFLAAARRFRRPDAPAFGASLGLALLAVWVLSSAVGLCFWDDIRLRMAQLGWYDENRALFASILMAGIMATQPLTGAAFEHWQWQRREQWDDPTRGRRPRHPLWTVAAAAGLLLMLAALATCKVAMSPTNIAVLALAVSATMVGLWTVLEIEYRTRERAGLLAASWLITTWLGPFAIDLLRARIVDPKMAGKLLTTISTAGLPGTLYSLLIDPSVSFKAGLAVQILLVGGLVVIYRRTCQYNRHRPRHRSRGTRDGLTGNA